MTARVLSLALAAACAAALAGQQPSARAIVAADGSGTYKTVQEAIDAVPQNTSASNRWTIFVKAGTYRERVYVQREKRFVRLLGEDASRTVITYDLNATMKDGSDENVRTYLGRPWRDFAQVTFVNTTMSDVVRGEGWHNWDRPEREKTSRYQESGSTGSGAAARGRVPWARAITSAEANMLSARVVLAGSDGWDPRSQ